jgi:hypothetical protein
MRPWSAQVTEKVGVGAVGLFQGIGQQREAVDGGIVVN